MGALLQQLLGTQPKQAKPSAELQSNGPELGSAAVAPSASCEDCAARDEVVDLTTGPCRNA